MKRLFVSVLILVIFLFTLASCVPVESSPTTSSQVSAPPSSSGNSDDIIKPSMFLVDDEGNKTYAVYFFMNKNSENCVVVADNYVAPDGSSNSAPTIQCN